MTAFDGTDYFTDPLVLNDPFPYFEHLRGQCPVHALSQRNVVAVTGYGEAVSIYNDPEAFSNVNGPVGPIPPIPFTPEGDDISAQLEEHRGKMPLTDQILTMDGERHSSNRSLMMRLFTPSRLRANEVYIRRVADEHLDRIVDKGNFEFLSEYGNPFAMLVIADLVGVPERDREEFGNWLTNAVPPSAINEDEIQNNFFEFATEYFQRYVEERRKEPRDDILSELATAKLPNGATPPLMDVVNMAAFLFGAGLDTTAKFLATAMLILGERPSLQNRLRTDQDFIPDFIEEVLRYDGPVKTNFRLARKRTTVGGVEIPAGSCVMINTPAANRDPRRFDKPAELQLGRPRIREHLAFGRGAHTCPGAALARTESRVSLQRILERLHDIKISDEHHGSPGARKFEYEPSYGLRGLSRLHLKFTPAN